MLTALHTVGLPFSIVYAPMTLRVLRVIIRQAHLGRSSTIKLLLSPALTATSEQKRQVFRRPIPFPMQTAIPLPLRRPSTTRQSALM